MPAQDAAAIRSRRDLRLINALMGNERWLARSLSRFAPEAKKGVTEWGAGDGGLARRLTRDHAELRVTACDLAPRPPGLPERVQWQQGDLLAAAPSDGGVLLANLFLHHFEGEKLAALAERCRCFEVLICNEPLRASWPHALGWLLWPLINHVTRHDLHVSVRAGFRAGELPELLGLRTGGWAWAERTTWRGALRFLAWKA